MDLTSETEGTSVGDMNITEAVDYGMHIIKTYASLIITANVLAIIVALVLTWTLIGFFGAWAVLSLPVLAVLCGVVSSRIVIKIIKKSEGVA